MLVQGLMSTNSMKKRRFAQTFLLASTDGGYFVTSDIFRFVEDVPNESVPTPPPQSGTKH